jgi:hypothetical protein
MLFSIIGLVTYAIWNVGVHENRLFVAVVLAFMTREHWAIVTVLTVMLNVNMFVFYGVTGTEFSLRSWVSISADSWRCCMPSLGFSW